jgi:hypothetical protein
MRHGFGKVGANDKRDTTVRQRRYKLLLKSFRLLKCKRTERWKQSMKPVFVV